LRALVLNRIKHPRVALAVHGAATIALVPAFVWLAPPSQWDKPGLLMVLLALAVISYVTEITLPNGLSFDAALELVLITLVLMGPLPAFLVAVVPLGIGGLIRRETVVRQGNLANVAAFGNFMVDGIRCSPDGIRTDVDGNLWCSSNAGNNLGYSGVTVQSADGRLLGRIRLPEVCPTSPSAAQNGTGCSWRPGSRSTPSMSIRRARHLDRTVYSRP